MHPGHRLARFLVGTIGGAADGVAAQLLRAATALRRRGDAATWMAGGLGAAARALHALLGTSALRHTSVSVSLSLGLSSPTWRHVAGLGAGLSFYSGSIASWEANHGRPEPDHIVFGAGGSLASSLGFGWDTLSGGSVSAGLPVVSAWLAQNHGWGLGAYVMNLGGIGLGVLKPSAPGRPGRGPFVSVSATPLSYSIAGVYLGLGGGFTLHHPALHVLVDPVEQPATALARRITAWKARAAQAMALSPSARP